MLWWWMLWWWRRRRRRRRCRRRRRGRGYGNGRREWRQLSRGRLAKVLEGFTIDEAFCPALGCRRRTSPWQGPPRPTAMTLLQHVPPRQEIRRPGEGNILSQTDPLERIARARASTNLRPQSQPAGAIDRGLVAGVLYQVVADSPMSWNPSCGTLASRASITSGCPCLLRRAGIA